MMALDRLILSPLRDSYQLTLGDDVVTSRYIGGMGRQRLGSVGTPHETPATFRGKGGKHTYIRKFFNLNKTRLFLLKLYNDEGDLSWYTCRFVGRPVITDKGNGHFDFSINLIVEPDKVDLEGDRAFIELYVATNGDIDLFGDMFEKLVNFDLPDAMRGIDA